MSRKVRVLIDTKPLSSGHAVRGIGTYTRQLIAALESQKNCQVLLSNEAPTPSSYDIVHYPYFDLFFSTLPLLRHKPTVVTIHDLIPLKFPSEYPVGLKGRVRWWLQQQSLRSVAAVITDSHASAADIAHFLPFVQTKTQVTYLAGNPSIQAQSREVVATVRKKYRLPSKYLLYVGDINYNKNLPQLIKSLKFLPPQLHLVCLGAQFRPQPIPEWQAIASQLVLSDVGHRVHFIDQLDSSETQELSALYSGAEAYVQPSLYEGFGLPVLEAMQALTPVVCAHNSSLIEVGADKVVFAAETTAEALAEAVTRVLDWETEYRNRWTRQALEHSRQFSWEKTAQQTLAVYQKVLL